MKTISKFSLFMLIMLVINGCDIKNDKGVKTSVVGASASYIIPSDSCLIRQKKFLSWYLSEYENINSERNVISYPESVVKESGDKNININKTKYYKFDKNNLNRYLEVLKKSGYFSDAFIENKRKSMIERGKLLDAKKQEDGPPEGFDFDEVFVTQEMYSAADINNLRLDSVNKNILVLPIMEDFKWVLYLKKANGICLIDSITSE